MVYKLAKGDSEKVTAAEKTCLWLRKHWLFPRKQLRARNGSRRRVGPMLPIENEPTAAKENGCRTKATNHAIAAQEMAVEKMASINRA